MTDLKLDLLQTLSLAGLVYFGGIQLSKRVGWLNRLNIPAAVVGGLLFTLLVVVLRSQGMTVQFDTALQSTLSVAFFTSIGMSASIAHLGTLDRNLAISVDTGQGLADRPVQRRRDCQELTAWVAAVPLRGMGMPPEMVAGTQRELVMARPWVVRSRTPLWAVTPPRE